MKTMRRGTSILLCLALLVAAIPVILPVFTSATAADDQEEQLLGTLSQRFEASGPGVISSGSGDAGGKSYGAYQFSSRSDIPRAFFRWCQSSSDTYYRSIGNRLAAAYEAATVALGEAVRTSGRTDEKAMARLAQVAPADIRAMRLGRR